MTPLVQVAAVVGFIDTGRMVVARGWGQNEELGFRGCRVSVLHDKDIWKRMVVTATQYERT